MTAVKGAAADVVRPLPPNGKHIIPCLQRAPSAPKREDGACNASPASVGLIVLGATTLVIAEGDPQAVRSDPAVIASYLGTDETAIARSGVLGPIEPITAPDRASHGRAKHTPTPAE